MQDLTPRGVARSSQNISQSQAPPTSSPLFFRSSPNGSQSQSQNVQTVGPGPPSSPLKRQMDAPSSEGGRTPRASGMGMGGGKSLYKEDIIQPY
jgi:DNA replication licensing factor MCM4